VDQGTREKTELVPLRKIGSLVGCKIILGRKLYQNTKLISARKLYLTPNLYWYANFISVRKLYRDEITWYAKFIFNANLCCGVTYPTNLTTCNIRKEKENNLILT
jgi:hypothetical protein